MIAGNDVVYNGKVYTVIAEYDENFVYLCDSESCELVGKWMCHVLH